MSRRPEFAPVNQPDRPLQTGGGGGTYDGMEARVAVLETHIEHIRSDISGLKADMGVIRSDLGKTRDEVADLRTGLATLNERVSHLPDKGFFVKSLILTAAQFLMAPLFNSQLHHCPCRDWLRQLLVLATAWAP